MIQRVLFGALACVVAHGALAADFTLFCAGAMKSSVVAIVATRPASDPPMAIVYGTAGALRERLEKGERPDVLILPGQDVTTLATNRLVDPSSQKALGTTGVGVAVRDGAPSPDIATLAAVRATLLAARKVVMVDPAKGTSGRIVAEMFRTLGIEDAMRDKTIQLDGGYVVEAVARGEADLGIHQVTEILPVKGVHLVGALPADLARPTRYDAAIVAGTTHRAEADAFLRALRTSDARARIAANGFTPAD